MPLAKSQSRSTGIVELALLLILVLTCTMAAQEITGSISGSVHDQSGAVILNATVVATRVETQTAFSTKANDAGSYAFPSLPIGNYRITAQAAGFKQYAGTGLTLNVNAHLELDIAMQVGSVSESMEVTAQPKAVNTESAEVSNLVNGEQVQELPLNGRNFVALTTLVPGTTPGSGFNNFDVGLLGGTALSVNGNASNGNLWLERRQQSRHWLQCDLAGFPLRGFHQRVHYSAQQLQLGIWLCRRRRGQRRNQVGWPGFPWLRF